ncbi:hypothetical protein ACFL2V_03180 [Pseudomonadota bacterium]
MNIKIILVISLFLFSTIPSHASTTTEDYREVTINFFINSLKNINDRNETFESDFYVRYKWEDTTLTGKTTEEIDWSSVWQPYVECVNSDNLEKQYGDGIFEFIAPSTVQLTQRYKGIFQSNFDLSMFPFDSQKFSISFEPYVETVDSLALRYEFDKDKNRLKNGHTYVHNVAIKKHISESIKLSEWKIDDIRLLEKINYYDFDSSNWSQFKIEIDMSRKVGFYIWNIIFVIVVLIFLSWCIFFIEPEKLSDRLRASISLFLSLVAFSLLTVSMLPKIPYMTMLDYFMKLNYLLIILTVVETLFAYKLSTKGENGMAMAKKLDRYTLVCFPILFIVITLGVWAMHGGDNKLISL